MMQTDVKSTHLNQSGVVAVGRCRIRGYQIAPGTGGNGQINFYDNATTGSGLVPLAVDVTTNSAIISTTIPGEGILFANGCYVALPGTPGATTITVFYA